MKKPGREKKMTDTSIRVEPIDNRHPAWGEVLAAIFRTGHREAILLREDGWLSSRQTVLAAFDGSSVVGHLCFRLEPMRSTMGRAEVQSKIDSFAVDHGYANKSVETLLVRQAQSRAQVMKCTPPKLELVAC
jgi:hypothetical protein